MFFRKVIYPVCHLIPPGPSPLLSFLPRRFSLSLCALPSHSAAVRSFSLASSPLPFSFVSFLSFLPFFALFCWLLPLPFLLPCCSSLSLCLLPSHSAAVRSLSLVSSPLPFCFVSAPVSVLSFSSSFPFALLLLPVSLRFSPSLCRYPCLLSGFQPFAVFFCPASLSPAATKFFQRHLFSFLFFRGLRNSSLSFVKQSSSFSSKTINKIGKNLCCSAESYRSCNMQHANGCFFAKLFT